MTLKKFIGLYIVCLIGSAAFARRVIMELTCFIGLPAVQTVPWILFWGILLLVIFMMIKQRISLNRVLLSLLFFVGIFLFLKMMHNPDERIHIFQYGLLGFLIILDRRKWPFKKALSMALCFVFLTACLDELFQAFLPNRIGDIRDVGFGLIGGTWGALQAWTMVRRSGSGKRPPR